MDGHALDLRLLVRDSPGSYGCAERCRVDQVALFVDAEVMEGVGAPRLQVQGGPSLHGFSLRPSDAREHLAVTNTAA